MSDEIASTVEAEASSANPRETWCDALERRSDERRRRRRIARLGTRKGSYAARVRDVSLEGVFVETHAPLSVGEPVLLQVRGERGMTQARGVVVRRKTIPRSLEGITVPGFGLRLEGAADLWATLVGLR